MAMQCLDGQTLQECIHGKPLKIATLLDLGIQIADARCRALKRHRSPRHQASDKCVRSPTHGSAPLQWPIIGLFLNQIKEYASCFRAGCNGGTREHLQESKFAVLLVRFHGARPPISWINRRDQSSESHKSGQHETRTSRGAWRSIFYQVHASDRVF